MAKRVGTLMFVGLLFALPMGCADDQPTTSTPVVTTSSQPTTTATTAPAPTGSKECLDLATAVRVARLAGPTPTEEVAERVAESLDAKLSRLSTKVHDPAVDLHGHLHDVASAQRRGRTGRATLLADKARADVRALANACDLPAADFLGTS